MAQPRLQCAISYQKAATERTYHIKVSNPSAGRMGWRVKSPLGVDLGSGVLDPNEAALIAVSCDAFAVGQEDPHGDAITIEWTNTPNGAANQWERLMQRFDRPAK